MFYQIGCILSEVLDVDLENLRAVLLKASRSDAQVLLSPFFSFPIRKMHGFLAGN